MTGQRSGLAAEPGHVLRILAAAAAAALLVPGLLVAWGALGQDDELHFCYVPGSGTVYRVNEPGLRDACGSPNHVPFSVNAQGPQGEKGDPGEQGPPGEKGDRGEPGPAGGLTGLEVVFGDVRTVSDEVRMHTSAVDCPEGKSVVGGGWSGGGLGFRPEDNIPFVFEAAGVSGWSISGRFGDADGVASASFRAVALCADAPAAGNGEADA